MRISDWSSDVCSSDLQGQADACVVQSYASASLTNCPNVVDACVPLKASPLRLRSGRSRPWNYFRGKFTLFRTTLSRSSRDRSERAVTIPSLSADGIPLLPLWYGRPLPVRIGRASCRARVCQYG